MPRYVVDSSRHLMTATGIVERVMEWMETADGRRRPSETQARDENTGMPLWAVEVLYVQASFGRESTVTARVVVGALEEPKPARLMPITFEGLAVDTRVNKAGGLVESWSAEALAEAGKQPQSRTADKAGEKANEKAVA